MEQDQPSNSVLEVKLTYISKDIGEIKTDIKEIKSDYVSRREFTDGLETIRGEIAPLKKIVYGLITLVMIAVLGAVVNLVLMS